MVFACNITFWVVFSAYRHMIAAPCLAWMKHSWNATIWIHWSGSTQYKHGIIIGLTTSNLLATGMVNFRRPQSSRLCLKYAQNVPVGHHNVCFGMHLTGNSNKERIISNSRAVIWYVGHSYRPYRFQLIKEKKYKIETFMFGVVNYEKG